MEGFHVLVANWSSEDDPCLSVLSLTQLSLSFNSALPSSLPPLSFLALSRNHPSGPKIWTLQPVPPPMSQPSVNPPPHRSSKSISVLPYKTANLRDHYRIGKKLGQGQFGTTYLCVDKNDGKEYACKSIPKRKLLYREDYEDVWREIQIMHHLSEHANVVRIKGEAGGGGGGRQEEAGGGERQEEAEEKGRKRRAEEKGGAQEKRGSRNAKEEKGGGVGFNRSLATIF